ncbi:MAG TPA: metal ABC transporter ATP-binding protein [Candidatus Acidoferrales bacterium]|nr:metal ABC transporter ATP-binding protein [Candidatus Acidoferrales bacterium]
MTAGESAAVDVEHLVVRYDRTVALDDVTFELHFGEAIGIVGPNGSGKSTLLKSIAGLLTPAAGTLRVLGTQPKRVPAGALAYVPQIEAVDWTFPANVWDVVSMGRFSRMQFWQRFDDADRQAVETALHAVNMYDLRNRHVAELSGGQQQRVFVARAIAQRPQLLLLDEPTTGVDAETEEALRRVVRSLVDDGMPVLMTTHDLDRVGVWFDRLLVLDRRVLAIGKPDDVVESGAYTSIREHTHTHGHARITR